MKKPFISVVVFAHDRYQFLESALTSVIDQTLPKELYEVILVGNVEVNPHLIEFGKIKVVYSNDSIGREITVALSNCLGEIICFLDDDDQWEVNKLDYVYSIFDKHPEIGYYHNGMTFMDESGKKITPDNQLSIWKNESQELIWLHPRSNTKPSRSMTPMVSFNNSCIAVRKSTVIRFLDYVEKIKGAVDRFLFYCSVADDCGIFCDNTELTRYRVHMSSSSVYNLQDFKVFSSKQAKKSRDWADDFAVIAGMCERFGVSSMKRETEILRAWFSFNSHLFGHSPRNILFKDFVVIMKLLISKRFDDRWLRIIGILSLFSLLWAGLPRHVIFNYYSRHQSR
jgi:glycosyltransferase involved in cell wall biosynthesis